MKRIIAVILFICSSIMVNAQQSREVLIVDFVPPIETENLFSSVRAIDLKLRPLVLKSLTDKSYMVGGKRLKSFPALSPYLADDIRHGKEFRHAISVRNQTKVLAIMTGIVFVGSLASLKFRTGGPPVGFDTVALAYGVPILGFLTLTAGTRYIRKRTKVEELFLMSHLKIGHYQNLDTVASLNFGTTQNGIGLVLNF